MSGDLYNMAFSFFLFHLFRLFLSFSFHKAALVMAVYEAIA